MTPPEQLLGPRRTLAAMADPIESLSHEEFIALLGAGIFTDDEIVDKIRSYPETAPAGQLGELTEAIFKLKGGALTGPLRTALRSRAGLPPWPDD